MLLNDPRHPEGVPPEDGDSRSAPGGRFRPVPLSPTALACLQRSLARQQDRRRVYRVRGLRVYLDGKERWQWDPRIGPSEWFRVPLSALSLELVGDDAEGALLLAVFPLPAPAAVEADGATHLSVTLEGGQTVTLALALDEGSGDEERAYVIQLTYTESALVATPGAAPLAVAALSAGPHPHLSTLGDPGVPAVRRPEDHLEAGRVDAGRDVVMVASGKRKRELVQLVEALSPMIRWHYRDIAGTRGTAKAVRPWLPMVNPLGQGPARGVHSLLWLAWNMLPAVVAYCRDRWLLNREVHLFVFFDHVLEQQLFREMLTASLLRTGIYWFPTPATARVYLQALSSDHAEGRLPLGTSHDHERAFAMAMQHLTAGEHAAGLQILAALDHHIVHTGEQQSRIWLLPAVQAMLAQWARSS